MASLMYGAGLRLLECAELRIKDLHFDRGELLVRDGKGARIGWAWREESAGSVEAWSERRMS